MGREKFRCELAGRCAGCNMIVVRKKETIKLNILFSQANKWLISGCNMAISSSTYCAVPTTFKLKLSA